jgi:hypothetical protein
MYPVLDRVAHDGSLVSGNGQYKVYCIKGKGDDTDWSTYLGAQTFASWQ